MHLHRALIVRGVHFVGIGKNRQVLDGAGRLGLARAQAFLLRIHRQVVATQGDVLRRRGDGFAARRRENVVGRQHDQLAFHLRLDRQRHVHGHLVAVKVRVVGGANERVNADGFAFDQYRLERLNGQAVQGRRTVEHDRVAAGHLFENVPDLVFFALDHLLGAAHGVHHAQRFQSADDEGFKQHEGHLLGQAALVHAQARPDHDHGAARIVHALAQQVLAEAPLLALEHVAQRLQRAVAGAGDGAPVAAVVKQGVHGFLQHAFFVADDDIRRLEHQQVFQAVVAVDHAPVQVVQVAGGKAPTLEGHQGAQVRRDHRQHFEHHPFRPGVAGPEGVHNFHPLGQLFLGLLAAGLLHLVFELGQLFGQVHLGEDVAHAFGAHASHEGIAVLVKRLVIFLLAQGLLEGQIRRAGVHYNIFFVVQHALEFARAHVQHCGQAAGRALEEPQVRNRHGQFNVAHALTAHARQRHFHAATVANHVLVLDALVFAARAFPVLRRTENPLAEQAALFGLEGAVVDGFRVFDFAVAPRPDGIRRGQGNGHIVKSGLGFRLENRLGRNVVFHRGPPQLQRLIMAASSSRGFKSCPGVGRGYPARGSGFPSSER